MKKYIIVIADWNDGEYLTAKNLITDEQLEKIKPVIEAIKNFIPYESKQSYGVVKHGHNFPIFDCLREDMGEKSVEEIYVDSGLVTQKALNLFYDYLPACEYGLHTIKHVDILVIAEEIRLM